jgi:V/A-type H+-transporting ATPase subunit C
MPRTIVGKLRLIELNNLREMTKFNIPQMFLFLENTEYEPEISTTSSENATTEFLEDAFLRNYVRINEDFINGSPREISSLLFAFLSKLHFANIKTLVRLKYSDMTSEAVLDQIIKTPQLKANTYRQVFEDSSSIGDVLKLLLNDCMSALKDPIEKFEETRFLFPIEIALDKCFYNDLWQKTTSLKGVDKKIARRIIGFEIDCVNIRVILRLKAMGVNSESILDYTMPITDTFCFDVLKRACNALNAGSSIETLLTTVKNSNDRDRTLMLNALLNEYSLSQSLSNLETILDKHLLQTSVKVFRKQPFLFSLGWVLAYLNLKWFEVKNLRTIVRGIDEGIPPNKIYDLLILP